MPTKPLRICNIPGCPNLTDSAYCEAHAKARQRLVDSRRASSSERGYTYRWQKASKNFLKRNPLCVQCLAEDEVKPSEVTDHIVPHKGDYKLFWDRNNWQALCKQHHDIKTAKEDGGFGRG